MMDKLVSMDRHLRLGMFFTLIFTSFFLLLGTGNMIFALLFFVFLGFLIVTNSQYAQRYANIMGKSLGKALTKNKFIADNSFLSDDYLSGIAINKSDEKIAIFKRKNINEELSPTYLNFKDIIECSIKEDNTIVTKTAKGSAIGHAIVGGALLGGLGAVVGGISGEKIASEKIFKATLFILVDDLDNPVHEIHFLNSNMLVDRDKPLYQKIYVEMDKWHKTISVIIKRNEKQLNSNSV